MSEEHGRYDPSYRRGFRAGVGMIVRGLLLVEADQADIGALIGALSRYEQELDAWLEGGGNETAPVWHPAGDEIGADDT